MSENADKDSPNSKIKMEPGTYKRLPSFRTPRDLKLTEFQKISTNPSEAKKKVYKPNLNVQRRKQSEEPVVKERVSQENKSNEKSSPNEKGKKEKGKKKQLNLIQSTGVFSEGLAPSLNTGRWNSRFSDPSTPSMLERPKYKGTGKVNKEEEAMVMKELLRDDFIDDPNYAPDASQCPIKLPLKNFGGDIFFKVEEDGTEVKKKEPIKDSPDSPDQVKVKVEEESEEDLNEAKVKTMPRTIDEMVPLSISQLVTQSSDTSFIFFQLPHCMPKEKTFLPTNSKQAPKPVVQTSTSSAPVPPVNEAEERSVLKTLPEGKIGKLQLMKSGQARLILGDAKFIVDPGTQPSFKQDVIALVDMTASSKTGNMVHIGNVTSRMIVSPDWETLLNDS